MRLRESNKKKRYNTRDYYAELDSSDEDAHIPAEQRDDSSDDGFVDEPEIVADGQDDGDEGGDGEDEVGLDAASESEAELTSEPGRSTRTTQRRKPPAKDDSRDQPSENTLGQVQPYPTDPAAKWTRTYAGPIARHARMPELCRYWYGDRTGYEDVLNGFLRLWTEYELAVPKLTTAAQQKLAQYPWMPQTFPDDQEKKLLQWYANYLGTRSIPQRSTPLLQSAASRWYLPQAETELTTISGPLGAQREHKFKPGHAVPLSRDDVPLAPAPDCEDRRGWLFDVGGIVLSMGWAPRKVELDQILALAVIPYSDQAFYQTPEDAPPDSSLKQGSIQIWKIPAQKSTQGEVNFTEAKPRLASALCFEWGRVVRLQWCPVPLTVRDQLGLLAVLTGDGRVRVVEVKQVPSKGEKQVFDEIQIPLATLELKNEDNVEITCFTWININRIAVGHSDGSVVVWSVYPPVMLQRHPVHSSPVTDITSSYPSHPFVVATVPVGGVATVTDLSRPNADLVYCSNLMVNFQPNLLAWSEHMRGYISLWPSSIPCNNVISFMAARAFPQSRFVLVITGQPTCLSVGACHPYVLVGSTDGTLWLANAFRRVFFFKKKNRKLKIFQHDYQAHIPPHDRMEEEKHEDEEDGDGSGEHELPRGVCRILHGFQPQLNGHPKSIKGGVKIRERHEKQKSKARNTKGKGAPSKAKAGNKKGRGKSNKKGNSDGSGHDSEAQAAATDTNTTTTTTVDGIPVVPGDVMVHDPLNRITAVAWNPNVDFSWWAAAAMASGLVRIMDLGVDQQQQQQHSLHRNPDPVADVAPGDESLYGILGGDDESGDDEGLEDVSDEEEELFVDEDEDVTMRDA